MGRIDAAIANLLLAESPNRFRGALTRFRNPDPARGELYCPLV